MKSGSIVERYAPALLIIALALTIAGAVAAVSLPVGLFPQVSFPRVVVDLDAGDRPADQMALLVTRPVEEAIRTVPGVQEVRSDTTRGTSQISIDFGWGRDMIASTLEVETAISRMLSSLPPGTGYDVRRMDPTIFPIISYALKPDHPMSDADLVKLRDLAQYTVVPLLSSISGLARVDVQGGATAEMQVEADPHRLAGYGLSINDLATAVSGGNTLSAIGRIQDRDRLYLVLAQNTPDNVGKIGDIVVRSDPAGIVRVRDVATVSAGIVPQWLHVVEDGTPAVLFNVYEQPDGNAVDLAAQVKQRLQGLALPPGVTLVNWYDQSTLVSNSAASVRDAVLIGLVLAGLVLVLFLRNLRMMLIAAVAVLATLAITVLVLSILGMSFNIMTLGGIAAAVGLLIDDVIVMLEHIASQAGSRGRERVGVLQAARSFISPLTGSSLATLIVFVPLAFQSGVSGAFSRALSTTMGAALLISYLVTALVVPLLARQLIDFEKWHDPSEEHGGWLHGVHAALLERLFRRPWLLLLALTPLLVVGYLAYAAVPTGFMPKVDEGGFVLDYYTTPGTSLIETEREMAQVDAMLRADDVVATFSRRLGTGLGGDLGQSYHGDYFVLLKAKRSGNTADIMDGVATRIQANVPGILVDTAQPMEDLIGDLTAVPQPIEIKLYADDPLTLVPEAQKVADLIGKVPGVIEVNNGVKLAGDALDVAVDPLRAGREGMTTQDVSQAATNAMTGVVATSFANATKSISIRVVLPHAQSLRLGDLSSLPIRAPDGHVFPLDRVATITPVSGQPQISRDNLEPMIAVTGRIQGRGIGAAVGDIQKVLAQPGVLASGMRYELGGLYQQQQIAFAGLAKVFAAALVAEFVLLMFLYQRFWLAASIIICSLFSSSAAFIALWVTGVELNITALMGLTMIIGIGTEMAIFYASEYVARDRLMPQRDALLAAAQARLRPITMTTLAAILTLLPLAFAIGKGSAVQQPLAIVIIGGLMLQFPLVLLGLPIVIGLVRRRG